MVSATWQNIESIDAVHAHVYRQRKVRMICQMNIEISTMQKPSNEDTLSYSTLNFSAE